MKEALEQEKEVLDQELEESRPDESGENESEDDEFSEMDILEIIKGSGHVLLTVNEYNELKSKIERLDSLPGKFTTLVNLVKDLDGRLTGNVNNLIEYGRLTEKRTYGMMEVVSLIESFLTSFSPAQLMKPSFYQNNKHIQFIEESLKYLNTLFPTENNEPTPNQPSKN